MSRILDHDTGEWIEPGADPDDYVMLDVFAPHGLRKAEPKTSWLATISAGGKDEHGYPTVNHDCHISLHDPHDQAPGLRDALEGTGYRSLTIAFASDSLRDILQARFTRHTASALQVFGDGESLTEIKVTGEGKNEQVERKVWLPTDPHYDALLLTCKVEVSVFFALAHWEGQRSLIDFPDGVGQWYRLRFTSRNSYASLLGSLQEIQRKFTDYRLAGIPFELKLSPREVAGPNGKKRPIVVWTLSLKPPATIRLGSGNFGPILSAALAEGARLKVAALPRPSMEVAELEGPDIDLDEAPLPSPTERELEHLADGDPPARVDHWRAAWFAAVRGTRLEGPVERHEFIQAYTAQLYRDRLELATSSLATFLGRATESQASGLVAAAATHQAQDVAMPLPPIVAGPARSEPVREQPPQDPAPLMERIADEGDRRWLYWITLVGTASQLELKIPILELPLPIPAYRAAKDSLAKAIVAKGGTVPRGDPEAAGGVSVTAETPTAALPDQSEISSQ
jgi:hypothetical protein